MLTLLKSTLSIQGGAEKYAKALAQAFVDRFGSITLVTSGTPPIPMPQVKIVTYTPRSRLSYKKVQEYDTFCTSYIQKHPTPYIFSLDRNSHQTHIRASNGVHAAYLEKRKHYDSIWKKLTHRYNPLHAHILKIEKTGFESSETQKIFTNSHMVAQEIIEYYKTPPEKIHVIHNGVEWHALQKAFDATLYPNRETCQLLFIGNGYRRKGLPFLLRALSLIKEAEFHLHIVGKEKDVTWFIKYAHSLGLSNKATFYGQQKDLLPFYQKADMILIPSYYDPFANVTLEALAMGVFAISSTSNGASEILNPHSGIGFSIEDGESNLAEIIHFHMRKRKTPIAAQIIRESVRAFDFSMQLQPLIAL